MSSAYDNEGKYASTSASSMLNKQAKVAKYCKRMIQCMYYTRVWWKISFRLILIGGASVAGLALASMVQKKSAYGRRKLKVTMMEPH